MSSAAAESSSSSSDWFVPCTEYEEKYQEAGRTKGNLGVDSWRPPALQVVHLFDRIEKEGGIALNWTCLGRRPPSPKEDEEYETDDEDAAAAAGPGGAAAARLKGGPASASSTVQESEKSADFDFDGAEEEGAVAVGATRTPQRPLGGQRELKGSARKKTTSFNSVLSNMKRHRQQDAANRAAAASTPKTGTPQ